MVAVSQGGMPMPPQGSRQARTLAIVLVLVLLAVVAGVWYAFHLPGMNSKTTTGGARETVITDITLGSLLYPEQAKDKNPKISQSASYKTTDQLVLRITTAPGITHPIEINARLLNDKGNVVDLNPSSVTFQPGTSGFCCWQVADPGTYTLQIFRPEKTITTIPLKIIKGFGGGNVPGLKL